MVNKMKIEIIELPPIPKKPKKPLKPKKTKKEKVVLDSCDFNYESKISLQQVIDKIPNDIDYNDVGIGAYYDGICIEYTQDIENHLYDKQMERYKNKLIEYKDNLAQYEQDQKEYDRLRAKRIEQLKKFMSHVGDDEIQAAFDENSDFVDLIKQIINV
jgi:hypothetical protein